MSDRRGDHGSFVSGASGGLSIMRARQSTGKRAACQHRLAANSKHAGKIDPKEHQGWRLRAFKTKLGSRSRRTSSRGGPTRSCRNGLECHLLWRRRRLQRGRDPNGSPVPQSMLSRNRAAAKQTPSHCRRAHRPVSKLCNARIASGCPGTRTSAPSYCAFAWGVRPCA